MAGTGTATIDFGATPVAEAVLSVVDAAIDPTKYVEAFVMIDSTVDNTVEDHRHAGVSWRLACLATAGGFDLYVDCLADLCHGTFKIRYAYA
jgi:hypothetical protein